ncbi:hypothetical protein [Pantoea ananatis]|uniref:hypothetical protein n=1 Tax=Pantoea ananas TaxID=553 RepID=UPI001B315A38|nr:hypothetical protein [Pantoea ananatis]
MTKKADIENALFDTELNRYCRKYIIKGEVKLTREDVILAEKRTHDVYAKVFEDLILNEKVNYKVHGENIPLAILTKELGLYNLEKLIENDSISFTLWTANVGYISSPVPVPGLYPLAPMRLNSLVHTDPEESIKSGLSVLVKKLKAGEERLLIRKLRDKYLMLPNGLENDCVNLTMSAIKSGEKNEFKLESEDIYNLSPSDKKKLSDFANELLSCKYLISKKAKSNPSSLISHYLENSIQKTRSIGHADIINTINKIENFPDLKSLYITNQIPLSDLMRLRNDRNAKRFRRWLSEAERLPPSELNKFYLDSIVKTKGFFDTFLGKSTKSVVMMGVGAAATSTITDPAAHFIGAAAGLLLQPAMDYTIDMIDEYFISEVLKGWSPRMFFDMIKTHSEKYSLSDF